MRLYNDHKKVYQNGNYWYIFYRNKDGRTTWYETALVLEGEDPLRHATQFVLDNLIRVELAPDRMSDCNW